MNTFFALMAEFETAQIPVERCAHIFGLSPRKATEYAAKQLLPVPSFRAGTQKSPWLIDAHQLAKHLDERKAKGEEEWRRVNS